MKSAIALTVFNILEIEKIPDEKIKSNIHYFLNIVTVVVMKGMDILFDEEVYAYQNNLVINPILLTMNLGQKFKDGTSKNYSIVLKDLLSRPDYKKTLDEHLSLLIKQQEDFQSKPDLSEKMFVKKVFEERLNKLPCMTAEINSDNFHECSPSYVTFAYSLYDKIGSKGLRRKSGEMNDTAMSYIFPYVGIVVTEKRQASVLNRIKEASKVSCLVYSPTK